MDAGLGERFAEARIRAQLRLRRKQFTQADMARLVTEELARLKSDKTVSQPQWSDYESGKSEPRARVVYTAVGNVSGLSPAYLAFGESAGDPFGDGSDMGIPVLPPISETPEEKTEARKKRGRGA